MFASVAAMGTAIFVVMMMGPGLALLRAVWAPMAVSAASVSVFHKPDIFSIYRESRYIEIITVIVAASIRRNGVVVPAKARTHIPGAEVMGPRFRGGRLQEEWGRRSYAALG
jgi:hypothetical protein